MFTQPRAFRSMRLAFVLTVVSVVGVAFPVYPAIAAQEAVAAMEATQAGFQLVRSKVSPAVVTIASTQVSAPDLSSRLPDFGTPPQTRERRVSGSGVIIRADGIVLTNSHVVQDATKVTVQLNDSEEKIPAEVVQVDTRTDLAIVRISRQGTYPTATLGDASTVQQGDWAIAFGSPFGLRSSMTVGIISATGRKLNGTVGDFNYNDLIQTDAAINSGNSGGPLANLRGQVIGINFMIFSPGEESGNIGIGFAIPINDFTRKIIDTLITGKAFERGRLGLQIDALSDTMREQFGVQQGGVLVQNVVTGMAADKAGIKDEDVIVEYNGVAVTDPDQFINLVQRTAPGSKVTMTIMRGGKRQQVSVTVGSDVEEQVAAAGGATAPIDERAIGLAVTTLTPEIARRYDFPNINGVLVTNVANGSPAEEASLRQGLIIVRVGKDTPVKTEQEFWQALSKEMATSKYGVMLRVTDGQRAVTLTLPKSTKE